MVRGDSSQKHRWRFLSFFRVRSSFGMLLTRGRVAVSSRFLPVRENWFLPEATWEMSRLATSFLLVVTLVSTNALVCNAQLNDMQIWRVGMIVGIGSVENLFHLTDQPVIFSPNKQYYLAVQAEPANNPLHPGTEFFCWLSVVNQSNASNKTNIWRAPCDQELQRSNDSMQLCHFGISADGNLVLSHAFSGGPFAFSSNTTGLNVDHAIVNNSGSVLLQTANGVTVWTSADHRAPTNCLGSLASFNHTRRAPPGPPASPPSQNTTNTNNTALPPPPTNSAIRSGRRPSPVLAVVCALIFAYQLPHERAQGLGPAR